MQNIRIKAVLLILISAVFALNSCNCFRVQNALTYRYDGKYTGIDTLINVDGYYHVSGSTTVNYPVTFYSDGTLTSVFSTKMISYLSSNGKKGKEKLDSEYFLDSIEFEGIDAFGLFKIFKDTIKTQVVMESGMGRVDYLEVWYKIISKDTISIIKYDDLNSKDRNWQLFNNKELQFYPAWRPDSTDNWLRDCLREKGAGK